LALYYNQQLQKNKNGKAAIVKVARKLLSRIPFVWLKRTTLSNSNSAITEVKQQEIIAITWGD
jgi:hypothetical protein